jgi:integrase
MTELEDVIEDSPNLARRTKDLYLYCVRDFLAFAGEQPDAWRLRAVEKWLVDLINTRGLKPQTARVYRKALRFASAAYARLAEDPAKDFAHLSSKIKVTRGVEREVVSFAEQLAILATCDREGLKDIRDRAILVLAFRTGLRREGIRSLDLDGIRAPIITTVNKGGDALAFQADPEVFTALEAWMDVLRLHGVNQGAVFRNVLGDKISDRMTAFQIWYVFQSRARRAGISRSIFPHLARHTLVTSLRKQGVTPLEISKLTGQTEQTIQQAYTHMKAERAVGAVLPPLLQPKKQ